ncbi:type II secretion system protein J [Deinococcus malanensis]|uniref:type II secretion system protein J n=1 Tax=Deinococcus malanensis TaxID=1706855 RepID=UPI003627BB4A
MNRDGFTLVELLVGMAILGILMALILNLQSTTIQYSTQQTSNAQRLQAINDVAGYVGAQVRAAQNVPDGLTINGSTCSRAGTVPCLAVILPVVETSAPTGCTRLPGTVIDWRLHAYRYIPRASIAATDRTRYLAWTAPRTACRRSGSRPVPYYWTRTRTGAGTAWIHPDHLLRDGLDRPAGRQPDPASNRNRRVRVHRRHPRGDPPAAERVSDEQWHHPVHPSKRAVRHVRLCPECELKTAAGDWALGVTASAQFPACCLHCWTRGP